MQSNGWIKLYRKLHNSDMYKNLNSKQRDVMINLLLLANHKPNKWEWQGDIFECEEGQLITSLQGIKKVCASDVSIQNIRTAIDKLEKWNFLTNKSTKTGRLITIVNWGNYQGSTNGTNKEDNKEVTKHQQSTNKALTTNKNVKNDNNDKKEKHSEIVSYLNEKTDSNFQSTTNQTVKFINGRLSDGYTVEDFKEVIDKKVEQWQGTKQARYLRPQTLFRPSNFESYLNEPKVKEKKKTGKDWEVI